jgi:NAD(P)H-hydrate epimerase
MPDSGLWSHLQEETQNRIHIYHIDIRILALSLPIVVPNCCCSMLLSYQQCRQFDKIAIEEYGVPGIVLMENAGASCAREIQSRYLGSTVVILCGGGNNGGDGFVIARHLDNGDVPVSVVLLADPAKLKGDAKTNFEILERMDIPLVVADSRWMAEDFSQFLLPLEQLLIVDAMLGTGVQGQLKEPYSSAVRFANSVECSRAAIDVPTGLGGDQSSTFKAELTFTFVGLKRGFEEPIAKASLGEIHVVDIGAPKAILREL